VTVFKLPRVIVRPTVEPVSLAEARLHLRLDVYDSPAMHPDDDLVTAQISAAREVAEKFIGRAIAVQTLEIGLDEFPGGTVGSCRRAQEPIALPGLLSLLSVTYVDGTGSHSLTSYQLDQFTSPPCLRPAAGEDWPIVSEDTANAVRVRYLAGYTALGDSPDTDPLPSPVQSAILLILGHLYENREDTAPITIEEIPMGAKWLLRPYRLESALA
jgi:uncharacterized phiE125 gp8 family phage protein